MTSPMNVQWTCKLTATCNNYGVPAVCMCVCVLGYSQLFILEVHVLGLVIRLSFPLDIIKWKCSRSFSYNSSCTIH